MHPLPKFKDSQTCQGPPSLQQFNIPHRHFDLIHVDIVGPPPRLTVSPTYLQSLTVSHAGRKPFPSMTSLAPPVLKHTCITLDCPFGIPMDLSFDRGTQFTSQQWTSIAQLLGIQLHHTTTYHPQSNGLVERFHRHLKAALRARLSSPN